LTNTIEFPLKIAREFELLTSANAFE